MLNVTHISTYGWEAAIRGMRNPLNSWDKTDSKFDMETGKLCVLGPNDLKLMKRLAQAGHDHGKFLRMLTVTCDIYAPLYWWKEFDTYKVGTVANSCSTMHKIHAKEFTIDDFSTDHLMSFSDITFPKLLDPEHPYGVGDSDPITYKKTYDDGDKRYFSYFCPISVIDETINMLNCCRRLYLETKDKKYWWQMIQLLPTSYNQLRTVTLNYEVARTMYDARHAHKLDEWHVLCDTFMNELPYFKEICYEPVE